MDLIHQKTPCNECPWRRDVDVGRFSPERFEALVTTAEDMSEAVFACHKTTEGKDAACAGFLLRGANHNLTVRMALATGGLDPNKINSGECALYDSFTEMALANGAAPEAIRTARTD